MNIQCRALDRIFVHIYVNLSYPERLLGSMRFDRTVHEFRPSKSVESSQSQSIFPVLWKQIHSKLTFEIWNNSSKRRWIWNQIGSHSSIYIEIFYSIEICSFSVGNALCRRIEFIQASQLQKRAKNEWENRASQRKRAFCSFFSFTNRIYNMKYHNNNSNNRVNLLLCKPNWWLCTVIVHTVRELDVHKARQKRTMPVREELKTAQIVETHEYLCVCIMIFFIVRLLLFFFLPIFFSW